MLTILNTTPNGLLDLSLDVNASKRRLSSILEELGSFPSEETNLSVILPLDQILATIVTDKLHTRSCAEIWILIAVLKCKLIDKEREWNIRFIPGREESALTTCWDQDTHVLQIAASAARRCRGIHLSRRYAPILGVSCQSLKNLW